MSFSAKSDATVPSASTDVKHASTYKEGEPVGLGWGRAVYPSQWISKQYDEHTAYGGQQKPEWQYASIAARYCKGPVDFIGKVWSDGRQIANWDYTFSPGEESKEFILNPSLASGRAFKAIVHRGTVDAPESGVANLRAKTGQNHPPYRGYCWIEWINIDLGQGSNSIPSFAVEIGTHAPAIGDFGGGDAHPYGVNPFAAIYALLLDDQAGNLDPALIDPAHVGTQCLALEDVGVSGRFGAMTYCHPNFQARTTLGDAITTILSYIDGFIYVEDGKIRMGWFPNAPVDASTLPEISEGDLTAKPSGAGFGDWNKGPTSAVVLFADFERDYETAPARYNVPTNVESRLASALVRRDAPFVHAADQAQLMAAEASVPNTSGDSGVNLTILKSRAVDGAGALLLPGAKINWDYGPHSLDLVCRVTARRMQMGKASDTLTIVRERGAFPRPYAAPVDVRVLPTPDDPYDINVADVRLWCLPSGFGPDRQVAPLINRTKRTIYRADLHFSPSGAAPWEVVLDARFFTAKCVVAGAGISAGDDTVRVTSSSVDFARMAAQSSVAQADDTLLMLLGDEVVSVGAITVVSAGTYDLAILRGRRGTLAAAHAATVVSWLFYRAELVAAEHADFYRVRTGLNVYDAGIATKYFKIQLFTIDSDGLAKPDDPGIALQLPDLTADVLKGYTVILTSEAHTVAADAAGTVAGGELGAGGSARTTVQVLRGSTPLTAVAAGPNSDQFSIALGTLVSTTATKETDDTVRGDTLTANTGSIEIVVSVAGAFILAKKFILTKSKAGMNGTDGTDGTDGVDGGPGPGVVYRGEYDAAKAYFHTTIRRDIVSYGGAYYLANNTGKNGLTTWGLPTGGDWAAFGATFSSVATAILLAEDATILRTLVMGDGATPDAGIIRSIGATAFGTGAGFWLGLAGTTAKFRVGDPAGDYVKFDGASLELAVGTGETRTLLDATKLQFGDPAFANILFQNFATGASGVSVRKGLADLARLNAINFVGDVFGNVEVYSASGAYMRMSGGIAGANPSLSWSDGASIRTDAGVLSIANGLKILGCYIRQQKPISHVVNLAGGSAEETFTVDISGYGFTAKPTTGLPNCANSADYKARYDFDDAANSATDAVIKISRFDGANTGADTLRLSLLFHQ